MKAAELIKQGIGVVGAITVAFGGFLTNIAPPADAKAVFPVGIASFILLFVFLLIRFTLHYRWSTSTKMKIWLIVAIISFVTFLICTPFYYHYFRRDVFTHLDGKTLFIKGSQPTPRAKETEESLREELGTVPDSRLVSAFGDPRRNIAILEQVWTRESLEHARSVLTFLYVLVVVSIGCAILSLTALWK